jgi:hypothetical protein
VVSTGRRFGDGAGTALAQGVPEQRVPIDQFKWSQPGGGSAMVPGQQTVFVVGDGKSNGLFSLRSLKASLNREYPLTSSSGLNRAAVRRWCRDSRLSS